MQRAYSHWLQIKKLGLIAFRLKCFHFNLSSPNSQSGVGLLPGRPLAVPGDSVTLWRLPWRIVTLGDATAPKRGNGAAKPRSVLGHPPPHPSRQSQVSVELRSKTHCHRSLSHRERQQKSKTSDSDASSTLPNALGLLHPWVRISWWNSPGNQSLNVCLNAAQPRPA